ncbi:MAG: ATP-binding protein [Elainellaceae cyanobacterium]
MIDLLRQIPLFATLHDHQFEFVRYGRERVIESGYLLAKEGDPMGSFWVLLDGEIHCVKQVGDRQVPWITYGPHSYFGHELILLDKPCLASAYASTRCHLIEFDTPAFWKMLELCPSITRELLVVTTQRAQNLDALSLRTQKLMSLGTLTSGLSQELRAPSLASTVAAEKLQKTFEFLQPLALQINQQMTSEQQALLLGIQHEVIQHSAIALAQPQESPSSDCDAEILAWLTRHGLGDRPYCAYLTSALLKVGLGVAWLDTIQALFPHAVLDDLLLWVKTTLTGMIQVDEIEKNTLHISQLVQSAKDYTYLDQAPLQEMDIHDGIENTLRVLRHRLTGIDIIRNYDHTLPDICVYGSDLNQVWTHVIENAIDAMNGCGQLEIRTFREGERVFVEIIDDGPGIPPEAQPHLFKQFFTTKGSGKGTGLGLPIAHRVIVEQHRGAIHCDSQPGRTRFQIRLPMNLRETSLFSSDLSSVHPEMVRGNS